MLDCVQTEMTDFAKRNCAGKRARYEAISAVTAAVSAVALYAAAPSPPAPRSKAPLPSLCCHHWLRRERQNLHWGRLPMGFDPCCWSIIVCVTQAG